MVDIVQILDVQGLVNEKSLGIFFDISIRCLFGLSDQIRT